MKSAGINGVNIWYDERGEGQPLLLVHGFPLDHSMWAGQIQPLSARCRVIAPDLRGFGRSPAKGDVVSMEQFADDLAALLDEIAPEQQVVLCGLSMGGYIALQFWKKYVAKLRGLILCDTRAAADSADAIHARHGFAKRVLDEGPAFISGVMLPLLLSQNTYQQHPEIVEQLQSVVEKGNRQGIAAASLGMAQRPDMMLALSEIQLPTLVVVGCDDTRSPPAEMQSIAQAIPGAQFVEIPAAGHLSPLENPVAFNAAIEAFLASNR